MNYGTQIQTTLTDAFEAALSDYNVKWPNRPHATPNNSNWLAFHIMMGGTFGETLSDTDRVNGMVQIDCYTPKLQGEDFAFEIADLLNTELNRNGVPLMGDIDVLIKAVTQPKMSPDANWHKMIINVSFYAFVERG